MKTTAARLVVTVLLLALSLLLAAPVAVGCDNPAGCVVGPGVRIQKTYLTLVYAQK